MRSVILMCFCLQFKGIQPFMVFTCGLDIPGDERSQLRRQSGLASVRKFFHKQEQEFRLVRELLC